MTTPRPSSSGTTDTVWLEESRVEFRRKAALDLLLCLIHEHYASQSPHWPVGNLTADLAADMATRLTERLTAVELRGDPESDKDRDHGPSQQDPQNT